MRIREEEKLTDHLCNLVQHFSDDEGNFDFEGIMEYYTTSIASLVISMVEDKPENEQEKLLKEFCKMLAINVLEMAVNMKKVRDSNKEEFEKLVKEYKPKTKRT